MIATTHPASGSATPIEIRTVPALRPVEWLRRGARDLAGSKPASLAHGLIMVALGWALLLMLGRHPWFTAAAVSGFLLVAPIMTTGLVELSRIRATGGRPHFDASLDVVAREGSNLLRFGVVLALAAVIWFALSEMLLAVVFSVPEQELGDTYYRGFLASANAAQLVAYLAIGAVLALLVFSLSVVTVPLMIDRQATAGEAMRASLRVVAANPAAMLVWSGLIVLLTVVGFGTLLLGMIVLIPLLGHATWHAYRDLLA